MALPLARLPLEALALALDRTVDRPTVLDPALSLTRSGDRLAGPAATLLFRPGGAAVEPGDDPAGPVAAALAGMASGAVVCLSLGGPPDPRVALWDRFAAEAARVGGLAGAVVDGGQSAGSAGPAVAAHGPALLPAAGRYTLVGRDEPVTLGGVLVRPGDLVIGDAAGIVVVPADAAETVETRARAIAGATDARLTEIRHQETRDA